MLIRILLWQGILIRLRFKTREMSEKTFLLQWCSKEDIAVACDVKGLDGSTYESKFLVAYEDNLIEYRYVE